MLFETKLCCGGCDGCARGRQQQQWNSVAGPNGEDGDMRPSPAHARWAGAPSSLDGKGGTFFFCQSQIYLQTDLSSTQIYLEDCVLCARAVDRKD
jgi:ferredoxin-like protein FixX